jgi:hypothetical protein
MARGKSNHTMFNKIMGNLEKNAGNSGHNNIFPHIILIVTLNEDKKPTVRKYMIFFPLCLYFFPTLFFGEKI